MKTVAIVQARLGSTRLPGKALLDLAGRPLIVLMLQRVKKSRTVDEIVLATGQGPENDALEAVVSNYGFSVFRGPEDDVLARYALTASRFGADKVVRLTGDCPLMDSKIVDRLVGVCIEGSYDYVTNVKPPSWPDGMDVSVFTREILQDACHYARKKSDREHVVPWMWRMTPLEGGNKYSATNVASSNDFSNYRWTVDKPLDYLFMKTLVSEFGTDAIIDAGLEDILEILNKNPEIMKINEGIIRDEGYIKDLAKDLHPFLDGKHIYLREVCLSDVNDDYCRWMNDSEVIRFTESRFCPYSKEALEEYVKAKLADKDTFFFAIILKQGHRHIGNIKLGPINRTHRLGDIGLIIGEKSFWGKGYATEAIGLVCRYAFETLNLYKLTAGYYEGNQGSFRVFKKNGFKIESRSSKYLDSEAKYADVTWMALFNPGIDNIGNKEDICGFKTNG